jgi:tRNA G18 (ribose-2'-O)-methylase SpoU
VNVSTIESIDDPRVAAYANLRERALRGENLFIAEGALLVERLLCSEYETESILSSDVFAPEIERLLKETGLEDTPVYVGPISMLREIVGFPFHRGALAIGRRRTETDAVTLKRFFQSLPPSPTRSRIVIGPAIATPDNVGLVMRSAAAFGADGVLLGVQSADPLSRRGMRLSMGAALLASHARITNIAAASERLQREHGYKLIGTVLDDRAEPLDRFTWPDRAAIILGNEYEGLDSAWIDRCDALLTIPMSEDVDSLNLAVSAGVFLYDASRGI